MTPGEVAAFLGVPLSRVKWLWTADYIDKADQYTFSAVSVERYAIWRTEAPRWRRVVRAATIPLRMV